MKLETCEYGLYLNNSILVTKLQLNIQLIGALELVIDWTQNSHVTVVLVGEQNAQTIQQFSGILNYKISSKIKTFYNSQWRHKC